MTDQLPDLLTDWTHNISNTTPLIFSVWCIWLTDEWKIQPTDRLTDWLNWLNPQHLSAAITQHLSSSSLSRVCLTNSWYSWRSTNRLPDTSRRRCHLHAWTEPGQTQRHTRLRWLPGWYCRKARREGGLWGGPGWLADCWGGGWVADGDLLWLADSMACDWLIWWLRRTWWLVDGDLELGGCLRERGL